MRPGPPRAPRGPRWGRRLTRLASGQAGPAAALALAAVSLIATLIAVAGPRAIAAGQTAALQRQFARLAPVTTGFAVTGQWQPFADEPHSILTAAQARAFTREVGAAMRPPLDSPAGARWAGATAPAQTFLHPPARAMAGQPPALEVAWRPDLAAHARLVSGSLPTAAPAPAGGRGRRLAASCPVPRGAGRPRVVTLDVAVTAATAARFVLRPGSLLGICPYQAGSPVIALRVTGVIRPAGPRAAFWAYDPVLAAPDLISPDSPSTSRWFGGVIAGPGELAALQAAFPGAMMQGVWFFPLDTAQVTAAALPRLLTGISRLSGSAAVSRGAGGPFGPVPLASSGLAGALAGFLAQQRAVIAIDSLLAVGLFATCLILLLVCARLAADAHRPELAADRARGASTAQVAAVAAARTCCVSVPAVAAGAAIGVAAVPGGANLTSWVLGAVAAVTAVAGPAAVAAWAHRRDGPAAAGAGRGPVPRATRLRRLRRGVAEATVVAAAAGALVALRYRGAATSSDPYLSAAPVLVAAAAGLLAARLYPLLVRWVLAGLQARSGAAGYLGLVRAARSGLTGLAPAVSLVLSLTLAALGGIIAASVTAGQAAVSWRQVGADVLVRTAGYAVVTPRDRREVASAPGITHTAAVYVVPDQPPLAPTLVTGPAQAGGTTVGLVVVDPAAYAALAAATPWPSFPAGALGRRTGHRGAAVPMLASAGPAAAARRGHTALVLDGVRLPVRLAGRVGAGPAMPAGGRYVVLPDWALAKFPSISGPDALLATGSPIDAPALRADVARTMPGAQVTLRRAVAAALAGSPAQRAGSRLTVLGIWVAAGLGALAVVFGLAISARERRRFRVRLAALGVSTRQARALALADTVPLLSVAVLGTLAAVAVLVSALAPALDLGVFTGSGLPVPLRAGIAALLAPAAAAAVLAAVTVTAERALSGRRDLGADLRSEEAG